MSNSYEEQGIPFSMKLRYFTVNKYFEWVKKERRIAQKTQAIKTLSSPHVSSKKAGNTFYMETSRQLVTL